MGCHECHQDEDGHGAAIQPAVSATWKVHMRLDSWTLKLTKSFLDWQCCIFASRNEPEVGHEPSSMQLPKALALNSQKGSGLHPRLPKLFATVLPVPQPCPGHAGNWRKMPRIYPNRQGCQRWLQPHCAPHDSTMEWSLREMPSHHTNLEKHDWSHRRFDHRNEHSTRRRPWLVIYPYLCYLSRKSSWHLIAGILAHCLWASLFPSLFFFKFWFSALQLWADLAKCDLSWMSNWIERGARDGKGARKSNICLRQKLCSALICELQVFVCFWNLLRVKDRNDNEPTKNITFPQSVNSSCKNSRIKGNLQMALHILHIFLFSPLLATELHLKWINPLCTLSAKTPRPFSKGTASSTVNSNWS